MSCLKKKRGSRQSGNHQTKEKTDLGVGTEPTLVLCKLRCAHATADFHKPSNIVEAGDCGETFLALAKSGQLPAPVSAFATSQFGTDSEADQSTWFPVFRLQINLGRLSPVPRRKKRSVRIMRPEQKEARDEGPRLLPLEEPKRGRKRAHLELFFVFRLERFFTAFFLRGVR